MLKLLAPLLLTGSLLTANHATAQQTQPDTDSESAIDRRLFLTRSTDGNPFAIAAYRSNYVLPLTFTSDPIIDQGQSAEIKFQFSLMVPFWRNVLNTNVFAAFGYTNQSHWQAFNSKLSSPFTETNHEPELFFVVPYRKRFAGINQRGVILGLSHQSNGRTQPFSRSWNRLYADFLFERNNTYFSLKTWYRILEAEKEDILQAQGDDNPDIEAFMGNFELLAFHKRGGHSLSAKLRHSLSSTDRGSVKIDYDFPISGKLKLTAHLFSGYGESLITYNKRVNRI
ncbi:MAG: phospholipase A, partial [Pseudomonadota bacterium]